MGDKTRNIVVVVLLSTLGFMLKYEFGQITQSIDKLSDSMGKIGIVQTKNSTIQENHAIQILEIKADNDIQDSRLNKAEVDIKLLQAK